MNGGSCPKSYVGRIFLRLNLRISQQEMSFRKMKYDSTCADHLINENVKFDQDF